MNERRNPRHLVELGQRSPNTPWDILHHLHTCTSCRGVLAGLPPASRQGTPTGASCYIGVVDFRSIDRHASTMHGVSVGHTMRRHVMGWDWGFESAAFAVFVWTRPAQADPAARP